MSDDADDADADLVALLDRIRDELDATAELPVDPKASPWLGEAAAVAGDAADAAADDADDAYLRERLGHVRRLLDGADDTGNEAAEDHVREARRLAERARERLADADG